MRANKYAQYFEQEGIGFLNQRSGNVLDFETISPDSTVGVYIGGDGKRLGANATLRNLRIYSVPIQLTTSLTNPTEGQALEDGSVQCVNSPGFTAADAVCVTGSVLYNSSSEYFTMINHNDL